MAITGKQPTLACLGLLHNLLLGSPVEVAAILGRHNLYALRGQHEVLRCKQNSAAVIYILPSSGSWQSFDKVLL